VGDTAPSGVAQVWVANGVSDNDKKKSKSPILLIALAIVAIAIVIIVKGKGCPPIPVPADQTSPNVEIKAEEPKKIEEPMVELQPKLDVPVITDPWARH
jgi:hypothetical protein